MGVVAPPTQAVPPPPRVFNKRVTALPPTQAVAPPQMMMMAPPPVAYAPQVIVLGPKTTDPMMDGIGMADFPACCMATCCPCMAVGEIADAIGKDYTSACCSYQLISCFLCPCVAACYHGCGLAQELRQHTGYNTEQNGCVTCCLHYVTDPRNMLLMCVGVPCHCCSCALTQELRLARKIKAQPTTVVMAGPGRQMM